MKYQIRELRDSTGLTQSEFSKMYGIPLSTLRKWEQGESSPPPYVLSLLAGALPVTNASLKKINGKADEVFYYDPVRKRVLDARGNAVSISEDLSNVKEQNLVIYLEDLFDGFYQIQNKFERDCRYDKQEDILWTR